MRAVARALIGTAAEVRYQVWTGVESLTLATGEPYVVYRGVLRYTSRVEAERMARSEPEGTALLHDTETGEVWVPARRVSTLPPLAVAARNG